MNNVTPFDVLPLATLTVEQEMKLATKIQSDRFTEEDVNALVMNNIKQACLYGKRCSYGKIHDDEVLSICYAALVQNAKRFKPGGIRFFAFAKPGIRGALIRSWTLKETVRNAKTSSLDEMLENQTKRCGENDATGTECPDRQDQPQEVFERSEEFNFAELTREEEWRNVEIVMGNVCSEQEQMVIRLTYKGNFSFQEIARLRGVTRAHAQSLHEKAIAKIRKSWNVTVKSEDNLSIRPGDPHRLELQPGRTADCRDLEFSYRAGSEAVGFDPNNPALRLACEEASGKIAESSKA